MKAFALKALTSGVLRGFFRRWTERCVPIVMLHRFSDRPQPGRVPRADLEQSLTAVRDIGLRPLTLGRLAAYLADGEIPPRSICFTVDDGYRDFADVAWPVFREFGVPATVFLTSGFVDGTMWNWWDRILYALDHANAGTSVPDAGESIESCKQVPDARRREMVEEIVCGSGTVVPDRPVEDYAAMDWETVARLGREGVEFGAHTVTHPILSWVDDAAVRRELESSVEAVRKATGTSVRSFAYPNGRNEDYDERAVAVLRELGVTAAVTTEYGIVNRATLEGPSALHRLPRVTLGEDPLRRLALFSGVEAAKIAMGQK